MSVIFSAATVVADEPGSWPATSGEDLTAAVRFERDRALEELLARADGLLRDGNVAEALPLLDEVLAQPQAKLVVLHGTYRDAAAEANRRLAALAPVERDRYERLAGDAARSAIQQAERNGDINALKRQLIRYRHTEAGRRGLRNLAQALCDQGRFDECVLACTTLIDESPQPDADLARDPGLALLWCTAAVRSEDPALARRLQQRFHEVLGVAPVLLQIDSLVSAAGVEEVDTAAGDLAIPDKLPSTVLPPVWSHASPIERNEVQRVLRYLDSNSVPPVSVLRPIVTSDGIVCRTWDGVVMLDAGTGATLWMHMLPVLTGPEARAIDPAVRGAFGDSTDLSLSSDQDHVYVVASAAEDPKPGDGSTLRNALRALRLGNGETAWELRSLTESTDSAASPPVFFRGPPVVCGAHLLIVIEQESVLRLLTLERATGRVLHDVPLCSAESGTVRDDRRLAQACSIRVVGHLAVCATGGGAIVAVDRMSGNVRWAYRYPRDRLPTFAPDSASHGDSAQVLWADGWRIPTLSADEQYVVFAGGESERCGILETQTGRLIWSLPRGDGLYVAAVTGDRIVIAGRSELRAHALANGEPVWRAHVGRIGGCGFTTEKHCVVPLADQCIATIDLNTGDVFRTWPQNANHLPAEAASPESVVEPVSLVQTHEGIVGQSLTQVWRADSLAAARTVAQQDATPPAMRAKLLGEAGDFAAAINTLRESLEQQPESAPGVEDDPVDLIADLSLQLLRRLKEPVQRDDAYAYGLLGTGRLPHDTRRQLALHLEWLSRAEGGGYRYAEIARTLSALHCERYFASTNDDAGRVRVDRAVQGKLLDLRARLEPAAQQEFDARFDDWDLLSSDPPELHNGSPPTSDPRLADLLGHLPFGQKLRLQQPQRWTSASEYVTSQLRLLEQSQVAEPPFAAAALSQLLQLYSGHSDPADAAGMAARLRDEFADVVLPDGTAALTIAEQASAHPAIARFVAGTDEWPDLAPTIASRPWPEGEIYFVPVSVQHGGGGLFDRLNVAVHRQGRIVRFSGAGMSRPWALTLPNSPNPLRHLQPFPDLRRAWGFGQFLVLQVGAEVFGISPLNAAGEPRAQIIWPPTGETLEATSAIGAPRTIDTGPAPDLRVAPFDEAVERRNEFGHLVGRVGPVRAGYFCVQREGVLIAYDTATGVELWQRRHLPPGVRCFGDDRVVMIHDQAKTQFVRLSALDGRPLDDAPLNAPVGNWLTVHGCTALIEKPLAPGAENSRSEFSAFDFARTSEAWRRTFSPRTVCFPVDDRWCGMLSPDGSLQFVRLSDGVTVAQHSVAVPQPLMHIRSIVDAHRIIVLVSGTRSDDGLEAATRGGGVHSNEGYRRLIVNGEWSAFDRRSGSHLWTQPLENASVLLDQPVDVPLLICNEQRVPPEGNAGAFVGRVRVFDRRHGRPLFDDVSSGIHNYYVVERDVDAGWVELRLPGRVVRFDYSADAQNR